MLLTSCCFILNVYCVHYNTSKVKAYIIIDMKTWLQSWWSSFHCFKQLADLFGCTLHLTKHVWCWIRHVPVEENVCFSVLHYGLVHLCYILIVKLVPLSIYHILTVCYVMSTCPRERKYFYSKYTTGNILSPFYKKIWDLGSQLCCYISQYNINATHCQQCHGDRWQTAGHR